MQYAGIRYKSYSEDACNNTECETTCRLTLRIACGMFPAGPATPWAEQQHCLWVYGCVPMANWQVSATWPSQGGWLAYLPRAYLGGGGSSMYRLYDGDCDTCGVPCCAVGQGTMPHCIRLSGRACLCKYIWQFQCLACLCLRQHTVLLAGCLTNHDGRRPLLSACLSACSV